MEFIRLCLMLAVALMAEGKPFYPTEMTMTRVIIDCVSLDVCGTFGGIKEGNFRHPLNSNWFYTCYGYSRVPECQQCAAPSLHFSNKCNMCIIELDDSAVTCPEVPKTVTSTLAPVICDLSFCKDKKNGLYADPADKTKFIQCSNEYTYCNQCQPGLQFDKSCDACVDPSHIAPTTTPNP